MSFQVHALSPAYFRPLFSMDKTELAARHAVRKVVDAAPGYPCRVSLEDAALGETVLLLNYQHQPVTSPFRSTHAIYVREHAIQALPEQGTIPGSLRQRLLSIRAFDADGFMVDADVVEGTEAGAVVVHMFEAEPVEEIHLHNAKPGCYMARVTRT